MNIRRATSADEAVLRELIDEFGAEIPEPDDVGAESWDDEWASISLRPGWSFYVTLESGPAGSQRAGPVILEADL